jgi:PIN domain nuclease of toxin-antitoxin system
MGRAHHRGGTAGGRPLSRYLLDTNFTLLAVSEPERLSSKVRQTVETGPVYLSVICYWEVLIKSVKGTLEVGDPRQWWAEALAVFSARALPVRPEHAAVLYDLAPIHKDPFDRMLIAQAIADELVLVTIDREIPKYANDRLRVIS